MMEERRIDVGAIRRLRQKTGAGLMDCRRSLGEADGDESAAETLLKAWGLAGAEKRAERRADEGCVFICAEGAHPAPSRAVMAALACETDFVARNSLFQAAGERIVGIAFEGGTGASAEIGRQVAELACVMKENILLGNLAALDAGEGSRIETYLHNDGRTGVLLRAEADSGGLAEPRVAAFLHDLALHIAAFSPVYVSEADVPPAYLEAKRKEFGEETASDERLRGKPEAMLQGIVAGKLRKHLASICLMDQGCIRDEKTPVSAAIGALARDTGTEVRVSAFVRFAIPVSAEPGYSLETSR